MPIQAAGAAGVEGTVEVFEQYAAGLVDLDGFSHIILLYQFHQSSGYDLSVVPFLTNPTGCSRPVHPGDRIPSACQSSG